MKQCCPTEENHVNPMKPVAALTRNAPAFPVSIIVEKVSHSGMHRLGEEPLAVAVG